MPTGKIDRSDLSVLIVDPSVVGESHVLVNTGFISLLAEISTSMTILSELAHSEALKKNFIHAGKCSDVNFINYNKNEIVIHKVSLALAEKDYDLIIFLNLEYELFIRYNLFTGRDHRDTTWWVLHSHLTSFNDNSSSAKIKNYCKSWLLTRFSKREKFFVCGDAIVNNLVKLKPHHNLQKQVVAVFHPTGNISLDPPKRDANLGEKLAFSLLYMHGWHSLSKERAGTLMKLKIEANGDRAFRFNEITNRFIDTKDGKIFARPYKERLETISKADFFLHLPIDPYSLQASGALMDMTVISTPVIGIASDFSRDLERIIGPFGYFFPNDEALIDFIKSADCGTVKNDLRLFKANLDTAYEKVRYHSLAEMRNALGLSQ